jgi:hypothetical protein
MSCNCKKGGNSSSCSCESCFSGVVIPRGPQGIQGPVGPVGPQGVQGVPGQDATLQPLNWIQIPLNNKTDWTQTGNPTEIAYYAVQNGILYLRGKIKNDSYTVFKGVFWESAPVSTGVIDTMCYEDVDGSVQKLRLFSQDLSYVGDNNSSLILCLDSVPPIRIY